MSIPSTDLQVTGRDLLPLTDPEKIYQLETGAVNLFYTRRGERQNRRYFIMRVTAPMMIFGLNTQAATYQIIAIPEVATRLHRLHRDDFSKKAPTSQQQIDQWVEHITESLLAKPCPKVFEMVQAGQTYELDENVVVRATNGVVWVQQQTGDVDFLDEPDLATLEDELEFYPLTDETWVKTRTPSTFATLATADLLQRPDCWKVFDQYHRMILTYIGKHAQQMTERERQLLKAREDADQERMQEAYRYLSAPLKRSPPEQLTQQNEPLMQALAHIGALQDIHFKRPSQLDTDAPLDQQLNIIMEASRARMRKVALKGYWWQADTGPLLGTYQDQPVALVYQRWRYMMITDAGQTPVNDDILEDLGLFGYMFYPTLPPHPLRIRELLKFNLPILRQVAPMLIFMNILAALLGLLFPIMTGWILGTLLPRGETGIFLAIMIVLLFTTLVSNGFQLLSQQAILRAEAFLDLRTQAAIIDRVLEMPMKFYRRFGTGDLGQRVFAIARIRQQVSGVLLSTMFSVVFSVFSLAVLFFYSVPLAWLAIGMAAIYAGVLVWISRGLLAQERSIAQRNADVQNILLSFILAVNKFRVAGAESRALAYWARHFAQERTAIYNTRLYVNGLQIFTTAYTLLMTIVIYAVVGGVPGTLSVGGFVAFSAALAQFIGAVDNLANNYKSLMSLVPLIERAQPIFETAPESDETRQDPGELAGALEVSLVSFRYSPDLPLALKEVSIQAKAGDFIALVGESGSGKSTLLRLLLGFDQPETGEIYYDRQDLSTLSVRRVRQQIGVVLQNGRLLDGSIFENIVGTSGLTTQDAEEAARMAGLWDDIKKMPMGIHTVINGNGATLSGGQRQRLLIARALVSKPRLIYFDEATSALDNRTQAIVSESLQQLDATRVVIAHRLSTIIQADHIYMLADGRVVQSGTYDQLMQKADGPFYKLAERQLL